MKDKTEDLESLNESSEEGKNKTYYQCIGATIYISAFGIALTGTMALMNNHPKFIDILQSALLFGSGITLACSYNLLRKRGLFSKQEKKDVNENDVLVSIENKM